MKTTTTYTRSQRHSIRLPHRQEGAVLVLIAIGMLIIVAMGALALDVSHAMLNKSRLQNTVDAAALAGASVLDDTIGDTAQAEIAARAVFTANAAAVGNHEIAARVAPGAVIVQFSATLEPFTAGSSPAEYVRVGVDTLTLDSWLMQLLTEADGSPAVGPKSVRASAVAGPSPTLGSVCDIVPLIVCGDPAQPAPYFGYEDDQVIVLKSGSKTDTQSGDIGPGNFQLAQMGGSGSNVVRDNLAGGFEGCAELGGNVQTKPGNSVGPVAQGLNTRLGSFHGPIKPGDYPPDVITETSSSDISYRESDGAIMFDGEPVADSADLDFNYDDYLDKLGRGEYDHPLPGGAFDRRNLTVVIANCASGTNSGNSTMPILGFGCFFMLQEIKQQGNEAEVYGEFVQECDAKGVSGPDPEVNPGPYKIQLYNDVGSKDS